MIRRWWTGCPHPCIGCGVIIQHPKAKRCPKCKRAHTKEFENARYRERKERGVCVACGGEPAVKGGRLCERHRERAREYDKKARAERRWRNQKFVNCEVCGCLLRKITQTKYCRPCSVDRNGAWHDRRRSKQLRETGLCVKCGKVPPVREDRTHCEECSVKKISARRQTYNERKREGLCTHCGKEPRGKTQTCEKCRRDLKAKEIRREIRKEG